MGLGADIAPGGHFPRKVNDAAMSVATLDKIPAKTSNHPSYEEHHGEAVPPAWALLAEHVERGFAYLLTDVSHAEEMIGVGFTLPLWATLPRSSRTGPLNIGLFRTCGATRSTRR